MTPGQVMLLLDQHVAAHNGKGAPSRQQGTAADMMALAAMRRI